MSKTTWKIEMERRTKTVAVIFCVEMNGLGGPNFLPPFTFRVHQLMLQLCSRT